MATRERCGLCHKVSPVGFHVPDDLWMTAVPEPHRQGVLCVGCFVSFADERLLPWDRSITFHPVSLATHLQDVRGLPFTPAAGGLVSAREEIAQAFDMIYEALNQDREVEMRLGVDAVLTGVDENGFEIREPGAKTVAFVISPARGHT